MAFKNLSCFTNLHENHLFFFFNQELYCYWSCSESILLWLTWLILWSLQLFWLSLPCLAGLYRKQKAQKITDVSPSVSFINALCYKELVCRQENRTQLSNHTPSAARDPGCVLIRISWMMRQNSAWISEVS